MERKALKYMIGKEVKYVERDRNDDDLVIIGFEDAEVIFSGEENSTGNDCHIGLEDGFEDLQKMVGETILNCYESINESACRQCPNEDNCDYDCEHRDDKGYGTWAFYNIQTLNHDCCLRFHGGSNGYYCEIPSVSLHEIDIETRDILRKLKKYEQILFNSHITFKDGDIEQIERNARLYRDCGEYKIYKGEYTHKGSSKLFSSTYDMTIVVKNGEPYAVTTHEGYVFTHKGDLLMFIDNYGGRCIVDVETGEYIWGSSICAKYIILIPDKNN